MAFKRVTLSSHKINNEVQIASKVSKLYSYWLFATIRIILCFIPQNGYIHPDEFFQSIEVMSGHYFNIDTYKPWEFNQTFPIRTIIFPYISAGIPYSIINFLLQYAQYYLGLNLKTVYFLVLFPRLFMCIISFINDYCLYKICQINNLCYKDCLVIFSSSYIMLTYATHTFSNSIELILLSLLLFYVSRCMAYSNKVIFQGNCLKKKYDEAQTIVDRVQVYKLISSLPSHSLNDCFIISSIIVAGIFNRPTFIAFAVCPIFFWLQRGLGSLVVGFLDFHIRIATFVICMIPALIFFILVDSIYYGFLTVGEILTLGEVSLDNFVVTPLNFIRYNAIADNLKEHGLHPRYLHFLINVPLLFNIYGLFGLYLLAQLIYRIITKQWLQLPRIQSVEGLMIFSFAIPIALLSVVPHQEPRFIIPVLFPLAFCCTSMTSKFTTIQTFKSNINKTSRSYQSNKEYYNSSIKFIWFTCNILLTIFYGFVHQGGILPLTAHVAHELKAKPELTHLHLFTSYTYPIPTGLLHLRNTKKIYVSSDNHKYKLVQDFYLHEMGNAKLTNVLNKIARQLQRCENNYYTKKLPWRIYYALPGSAFKELMEISTKYYEKEFKLIKVKNFYPHVSTEMLPKSDFLKCIHVYNNIFDCINMVLMKPTDNIINFFSQFRLILLKVVPGEKT